MPVPMPSLHQVELTYLFSTTSNEYPCIELLLDFVQRLDITPESVEKEKVIGQEIKMYDDDPDGVFIWINSKPLQ
ncbi:MAG: hypothetical protein ACLRWM_05525 [Streptococcus sp.]